MRVFYALRDYAYIYQTDSELIVNEIAQGTLIHETKWVQIANGSALSLIAGETETGERVIIKEQYCVELPITAEAKHE